jgi:YD repeat-containing protein
LVFRFVCVTVCCISCGLDILVSERCFFGNFRLKFPLAAAFAGILFSICSTGSVLATAFTYSYDSLNRLTNAVSSDGSTESYSYDNAGNRLSRSTSAATVQVDTTPPSVPANLVTNNFTPSRLSFDWDRSSDTGGSGLAGYQIYVNGQLVTTTTTTNFVLSGLMPNTQYCLSVAAFDRDNNISVQSASLCVTTPVFEPPYLVPSGFANGQFRIAATSGTAGPYDVFGSSNLLDWQWKATVWLPLTNIYFTDPDSNVISPYFYRFGWSTNTP